MCSSSRAAAAAADDDLLSFYQRVNCLQAKCAVEAN